MMKKPYTWFSNFSSQRTTPVSIKGTVFSTKYHELEAQAVAISLEYLTEGKYIVA
jgi:hypothetical protein